MRRIFRLGPGHVDVEREVDEELAFHLEMRTQKLMARGLDPEAARREALRQFGDLERVRTTMVTTDYERERTMRRANYLEELRQDLWQAARVLRNNAGFAVTVILMLAIGIGANTTIFTLVDAVLLRNLPVEAPRELIVVGDPSRTSSFSFSDGPQTSLLSYPLYKELRDNNKLVSGLLASGRSDRLDVHLESQAGEAEHPRGRFVSGNYFSVLGVPAALGRTFDAGVDASIGGAPVVTISHAYWMRRFDGDRGAVGRRLVINGNSFTVIGVTPPSFSGEIVGTPTDIWLPISMRDVLTPNQRVLDERNAHWLLLMGRLAPGTTLPAAQAGFTTLVRRFVGEQFGAARGEEVRTLQVHVSSGARGLSRVRSTFGAPLLTLMTGVALLLLIVCANVANLLLARSVARAREMTVRVAIGAGRLRIVRQLLTECFLLAFLGAAGGLALAWYGSRLLLALAGNGSRALPLDVRLDLPVLAFTALSSVVAVALFGLVPAFTASRVDLATAMRAHARSLAGGGARRGRFHLSSGRLLISAQVALSLVLLVGAALLVRSLQNIERVDTGLDRDHLLVADVDKLSRGYEGDRTVTFARELSERFARLPGVTGVSYSENGIFSGMESAVTLQVAGFTASVPDDSVANYDQVSPGYVRAIGARLLQGREFGPEDVEGSERVAMINQTMARFYFGDRPPLGEFLRFDDSVAVRVVGVLADVKDHSLDGEPARRFYLPYLQRTFGEPGALRFQLRTAGDPAVLRSRAREEIRAVDPLLAIDEVEPLSFLMRQSVSEERLLARLASGFGALALLLAAFGLYGVLTYAVTRRTGEIGLRVALGAQRTAVVGLVLRDALALVAIGVAVGAPLSVAGGRLLANQLHGIGAIDPPSVVVALVALLTSAAAAALIPAMRASRVTPLTALREE